MEQENGEEKRRKKQKEKHCCQTRGAEYYSRWMWSRQKGECLCLCLLKSISCHNSLHIPEMFLPSSSILPLTSSFAPLTSSPQLCKRLGSRLLLLPICGNPFPCIWSHEYNSPSNSPSDSPLALLVSPRCPTVGRRSPSGWIPLVPRKTHDIYNNIYHWVRICNQFHVLIKNTLMLLDLGVFRRVFPILWYISINYFSQLRIDAVRDFVTLQLFQFWDICFCFFIFNLIQRASPEIEASTIISDCYTNKLPQMSPNPPSSGSVSEIK